VRIALAVEGTRGDVHPMLALAGSLAERGHHVLVCGPPDFAVDVRTRGFEFHPIGVPVQAYLRERAHVITRGGLGMMREGLHYIRQSVETQLEELADAFCGVDFAFGAGVQVGAPTAAEYHRIPYRYVAYCPAILPSGDHPPFTVEWRDTPAWVNRIAWRLTRSILNRVLSRPVSRARRRLGLPALADIVPHMFGRLPVLAADAPLAPLPDGAPDGIEQIRCLHPFQADSTLPAKLESFLAAGPPPVYLGFGSMTDPEPAETTRRLVDGVGRLGLRAVLSEGWAGLGGGALPEGFFVTGAVSHAALFPRMAAVVHHGGAGTTTTAARAGVPQVVVPHVLDQYYWACRVERLGLGPPALPRRHLAPEALARAIGTTVEAEVMRERASEMGTRLRAAAAAPIPDLLRD